MGRDETLKLKVCGMRDPENIRVVAGLSPDYMGFIFYEGSRRFVGKDFNMPGGLPASIIRVGVFVNESTVEITRLAGKHGFKVVQLHGQEPPQQCEQIRAQGLQVIKAFSIGKDFDFDGVRPFEKFVDFFLFDAKGKNYGGNGLPFDWKILEGYQQQVPFLLSGGISPENVSGIADMRNMNLHAIDVNSGVEKATALKDPDLIKTIKERMHVK